jgi:hypothetical protein
MMSKYLYLFLVFIVMCTRSVGQQNMVPNGNFEEYITCPSGTSQLNVCTGWKPFTNGSSDYYNTCGTGNVGVPSNIFGYQQPASGNGYAGGVSAASGSYYKEYIARSIIPLTVGQRYVFSISVSLGNGLACGTNDVGVYFFKDAPAFYNINTVPPVTPQIEWPDIVVTDTQNWVRLSKFFVADSAYTNIVIGGFKDGQTIISVPVSPGVLNGYYYFDSVVLKVAEDLDFVEPPAAMCAGSSFVLSYNAYLRAANNVFTVELSDASGSFASPVVIGTKVSDTSGTILCNIPANIPTGTGYKVRLLSSNPKDTATGKNPISIGNPADIVATVNSPVCEGQTLQFTGTGTPTTYAWTGPLGFNSNSASPILGNASTVNGGDYYATVQYYGCTVKDTLTVLVKPSPAKPDADNNGPLCQGATLNLNAITTTPGVSYSWSGPNSYTSSLQNPPIANAQPAMSGDYIVNATFNGCSRADTTTVLIKPNPAATVLSSNSPVCMGNTLQLNSTGSTAGTIYSWAGPNGFGANTQNATVPNVALAAAGWYKQTLTLNGCSIKDSVHVAVNATPAAPTAGYTTPVCAGTQLKLTASSVAGATYSWTGPNGFTSNVQNAVRNNLTVNDAGVYSIIATVNGCSSLAAITTVNINPTPFVTITTPTDSICQGVPVTFVSYANNVGGSPTYRWLVNQQPVGTGASYIAPSLNDGDVVSCEMTEYTKCSAPYTDESNDIKMAVLAWLAPSVSISATPSGILQVNEYVTFTATATNAGNTPTYQWKRNGQNVQGATSHIWSANTLSDNDNITVDLSSSYKCPQPITASSNSIVVRIATGINDVNAIGTLSLYPNPNNGKFTLKGVLSASSQTLQLQIVNTLGQLVYSDAIEAVGNKIDKEINLNNILHGVYTLKVVGASDVLYILKFIVE